ncbi:SDR family NAD(P)-dependent oxidoreductase, partial [Acidisphaera rubrifaciens]|uniref:SDR family NAD(P)-dependent oxidoreductase n=1 Tax=Acidisphaera rubrifaciens TaxID=50715 RepID=UPI0006626446
AVLDVNMGMAEALAREVGGLAIRADVGDETSLRDAAARLAAEWGEASILVNSAGVLQVPLRPSELAMDTYDRVVHIDQRGTYLACAVFGQPMVARRRGAIVNIASVAGMRSMPLHAYAPAKAAVISITQCLAAEWGPAGVRVNAVSPGFTRTPALQAAIDRGERDPANLIATAAMGRLVSTDEVARAVAFLCSDDASAITGVTLPVDCGWLVAPSWATYGGLRAPGNA